jgi:hypothetical protein
VLTPISSLQYANRTHIDEDIAKAREIVGTEKDNIAYVQLNTNILKMINAETEKKTEANRNV